MKLGTDYVGSMNQSQGRMLTSGANLGTNTRITADQLQEVNAKINHGAGTSEIGFMGRGKGIKSQGQGTPESYGKSERQAMRELAKVNNVNLSVHASTMAGSWAGFHENRFDENTRQQNIFEGKKAVEFAADATQGGPVVVHTAEFPRGMIDAGEEGKGMFETLGEGKKLGVHYLMNQSTGQLITAIREDQTNTVPEITATHAGEFGDEVREGGWVKDAHGNPIPGKKFQMITKTWENYVADAKANETGIENGEIDREKANIKNQGVYDPTLSIDPAVLFWNDHINAQKWQAQGQADEYENIYQREQEAWTDAKTKREIWSGWGDLTAAEKATKLVTLSSLREPGDAEIPNVAAANLLADEQLNVAQRHVERHQKNMSYGRETAFSARATENKLENEQKKVIGLKEYALDKTSDSLSELAIHAMRKQEGKEHLKDDIYIAPENIFPEMGYGSHPEELREVVVSARNEFARKLIDPHLKADNGDVLQDAQGNPLENPDFIPGMSEGDASALANKHIRAAFDIGHAHTWKKYFKGKPEDFNDWLLGQVKMLRENDIIGHVHITDNFGYHDEHLSPGEGDVPINEFIDQLKESGFKGRIIEETAEQDYKAMTQLWSRVNSPVYQINGDTKNWTEVQGGYFGMTQSPTFLVGSTAPDPQVWTTWSGLPLE